VIRLALRVRRADAELVLADLLELAPGGVEECDIPAHDGGEGIVEYAVYGSPGELPELPDVRAAAGGALVDVSTREVPDDWSERWKRFHRPVLIEAPGMGGRDFHREPPCLHVRPPWEVPSDRPNVLEIVIDPAQAFGTGAHATTRLCMEMLLDLVATGDPRGAVLDVGAGSGVLAIAAVKLGYGPVLALDNDRESVSAIVANAAVNGVELEARRFDLRREALPWLDGGGGGVPRVLRGPVNSERLASPAGGTVMLANLLRPLLLELADTMGAQPRHLIASGLLCEQAGEVAEAFATRLGLRERARRERGEWAALWLTSARFPHAPSP
jgi:ribosomal protein L11 methyltransferase